jgi:hypothetical protein
LSQSIEIDPYPAEEGRERRERRRKIRLKRSGIPFKHQDARVVFADPDSGT